MLIFLFVTFGSISIVLHVISFIRYREYLYYSKNNNENYGYGSFDDFIREFNKIEWRRSSNDPFSFTAGRSYPSILERTYHDEKYISDWIDDCKKNPICYVGRKNKDEITIEFGNKIMIMGSYRSFIRLFVFLHKNKYKIDDKDTIDWSEDKVSEA